MKPLKLTMVGGATYETEMVDLLDRILDKGIVIDAGVRIFLAGIDLRHVSCSLPSTSTAHAYARVCTVSGIRHVTEIPPNPLPEGRVLVHNRIIPQRVLGANGFRAWTQALDGTLVVCSCDWAGEDLHGLVHYRVKGIPER